MESSLTTSSLLRVLALGLLTVPAASFPYQLDERPGLHGEPPIGPPFHGPPFGGPGRFPPGASGWSDPVGTGGWGYGGQSFSPVRTSDPNNAATDFIQGRTTSTTQSVVTSTTLSSSTHGPKHTTASFTSTQDPISTALSTTKNRTSSLTETVTSITSTSHAGRSTTSTYNSTSTISTTSAARTSTASGLTTSTSTTRTRRRTKSSTADPVQTTSNSTTTLSTTSATRNNTTSSVATSTSTAPTRRRTKAHKTRTSSSSTSSVSTSNATSNILTTTRSRTGTASGFTTITSTTNTRRSTTSSTSTSTASTGTTSSSTGSTTKTTSSTISTPTSVVVPGGQGLGDTYTLYQGAGTIQAGWPGLNDWIDFDTMWENNQALIKPSCSNLQETLANDSPDEIEGILNAINSVSASTGVPTQFILAVMIEESKGCVRVQTTFSVHPNPGLMQSFNGTGTCNNDGTVRDPCPDGEIRQMINDGVAGTASGPGLVQDLTEVSVTDVSRYYKAARLYNSGSIPTDGNLSGPGANPCYCSDIANRLTGWVLATTKCHLTNTV